MRVDVEVNELDTGPLGTGILSYAQKPIQRLTRHRTHFVHRRHRVSPVGGFSAINAARVAAPSGGRISVIVYVVLRLKRLHAGAGSSASTCPATRFIRSGAYPAAWPCAWRSCCRPGAVRPAIIVSYDCRSCLVIGDGRPLPAARRGAAAESRAMPSARPKVLASSVLATCVSRRQMRLHPACRLPDHAVGCFGLAQPSAVPRLHDYRLPTLAPRASDRLRLLKLRTYAARPGIIGRKCIAISTFDHGRRCVADEITGHALAHRQLAQGAHAICSRRIDNSAAADGWSDAIPMTCRSRPHRHAEPLWSHSSAALRPPGRVLASRMPGRIGVGLAAGRDLLLLQRS